MCRLKQNSSVLHVRIFPAKQVRRIVHVNHLLGRKGQFLPRTPRMAEHGLGVPLGHPSPLCAARCKSIHSIKALGHHPEGKACEKPCLPAQTILTERERQRLAFWWHGAKIQPKYF